MLHKSNSACHHRDQTLTSLLFHFFKFTYLRPNLVISFTTFLYVLLIVFNHLTLIIQLNCRISVWASEKHSKKTYRAVIFLETDAILGFELRIFGEEGPSTVDYRLSSLHRICSEFITIDL